MADGETLKNTSSNDRLPGSLDIYYCPEIEADLYKHYKSCRKYPDHKEFIPVDKFDITHLPKDYQDEDIVEYIKLVAQFTVRLTARYFSPERPATVPGTDKPYPGYQKRGSHATHSGTGLITDVVPVSENPKHVLLEISTAAHVVFDRREVEHTTCHLFFDNGNQPDNTVHQLDLKADFPLVSSLTDECVMGFVTGNINLIEKMYSGLHRLLQLKTIIGHKLEKIPESTTQNSPVVIVSHPHGCSKKISIGLCMEIDKNLDKVSFQYNAPTCPGSSGAAVICLDKETWYTHSVHSGTTEKGNLNTGSCRYNRSSRSLDLAITGLRAISDPAFENTLLKDDTNKLPSDEIPKLPLPLAFRYNIFEDLFQVLSELCFELGVMPVSYKRPKFWPGTRHSYPWYEKRGTEEGRGGYGWVNRVDIYPNQSSPNKTCDCSQCKVSLMKARNFAHIFILTSNSLVFDEVEVQRVFCITVAKAGCQILNIFGSPDVTSVSNDVESDRCELVIKTHDMLLAEKLNSSQNHFSSLKKKIEETLLKSNPEYPLTAVVDDIGGITLGSCCVDGSYRKPKNSKSIGAPVLVLGDKNLQWDVSGHTGDYPQDPSLGYSRYLQYQYKKSSEKLD